METITNTSYQPRRYRGLCFGIILITIGAVLLGLNFGYIPQAFKGIIFSWPSIIIVIGLLHMRRRHQIVWGSIWIMVGTFFLIPKIVRAFPELFPGIGENFAGLYWPLLLILAGLTFIIYKIFYKKNDDWVDYWKTKVQHQTMTTGNLSSGFEKNSIFGAGEHIILDDVFTGGELNAIFGSITLDLRRTNLPEGGDAHLELNAIFGSVTLYVPGDWVVISQIDAIFGGFEDKRRKIDPADNTKRLIVKGSCVFGGGEIIS